MDERICINLLYWLRGNLLADLYNARIIVGPSDDERIVLLFYSSSVDADFSVRGLRCIDVNSGDYLD